MSALNPSQFKNANDIEEKQRRRFHRKHESGFVGNGYWYAGYPYIVGTLNANTDHTLDPNTDHDQPMSPAGQSASATDGTGMGGTAAGYVGGLGS